MNYIMKSSPQLTVLLIIGFLFPWQSFAMQDEDAVNKEESKAAKPNLAEEDMEEKAREIARNRIDRARERARQKKAIDEKKKEEILKEWMRK